MKLDFNEIKKITRGALQVYEREDGVHFFRVTDTQIKAWEALREDLGERSRFSSGIHLDFHTNSKTMRFYALSCTMYDVLINGLLRKRVNMHAQRRTGEPAVIDLTDPLGNELDDVRVTIYFPRGNDPVVLSALELDDGAYVRPHEYNHKFLFLGDSITMGCSSEHHSFCYSYAVSNFFNAESLNQCVGGGRFEPTTLEKIDYEPDTVFIAYGTNDYHYFKTLEELEAHADEYLSKVHKLFDGTAKRYFVISPIWRGDLHLELPMGSFDEARDVVIRMAKKHGMTHIDGLTLIPPIPEFFEDKYLHPNDLGFGIYTQNVLREIVKYF